MGSDHPIVDIHNHLLPGVDDGSQDVDMSLELIDQGLENGIGAWVLTPHVLDEFTEHIDKLHRTAFEGLKSEVERRSLPVELYLASEIMFQMDVKSVAARQSATFNGNGVYFLMEFPMSLFPVEAEDVLFKFQLAGLKPIIAHPERNQDLVRNVTRLKDMAARGVLFQINARSLVQTDSSPMRKVAEELILDGSAHFIASDAHDPIHRPATVRECWDRVAELAGEETAVRLFCENPRKAVEGVRIESVVPDVATDDPWWRRVLDFLGG